MSAARDIAYDIVRKAKMGYSADGCALQKLIEEGFADLSRRLAIAVEAMENAKHFTGDVADNYDCDETASHQTHGVHCRACKAENAKTALDAAIKAVRGE